MKKKLGYIGVSILAAAVLLSSCLSGSLSGSLQLYEDLGVSSTKNSKNMPDTPDADLIVSTLAGEGKKGLRNGPGDTARFRYPAGMTVDPFGNVYVADAINRGIRMIEPNGEVNIPALMPFNGDVYKTGGLLAGTTGSRSIAMIINGIGAHLFANPMDVIVGADGYLYMVAYQDNRIWKIAPGHRVEPQQVRYGNKFNIGGEVSVLVGSYPFLSGDKDGSINEAEFNYPRALATDGAGNIYVADTGNHRIRKITTRGEVLTLAGSKRGFKDGAGAEAKFHEPIGIAVDSKGNVYVADSHNHSIRKVTPEGVVSTLAGSGEGGFVDGSTTEAQFNRPTGVAVDSEGNVYVADQKNNLIRKITPEGMVSTYAGNGMAGFSDGSAVTARFRNPYDVVVDSDNTIYVSDTGNQRIRIIEDESRPRQDVVHAK